MHTFIYIHTQHKCVLMYELMLKFTYNARTHALTRLVAAVTQRQAAVDFIKQRANAWKKNRFSASKSVNYNWNEIPDVKGNSQVILSAILHKIFFAKVAQALFSPPTHKSKLFICCWGKCRSCASRFASNKCEMQSLHRLCKVQWNNNA